MTYAYSCAGCGATKPQDCHCGERADKKYGPFTPKSAEPRPIFTTFDVVYASHGPEIRIKDPDTGGEKGSKPQRMDLLPWDTLMKVSEHYAYGATKYEDRNWERGYAWHLSFSALQRHLAAFWQGEDIDEDTGSHHMAAACFHALALFTYVERGLGTDDRP